jgi:hypothetical protein
VHRTSAPAEAAGFSLDDASDEPGGCNAERPCVASQRVPLLGIEHRAGLQRTQGVRNLNGALIDLKELLNAGLNRPGHEITKRGADRAAPPNGICRHDCPRLGMNNHPDRHATMTLLRVQRSLGASSFVIKCSLDAPNAAMQAPTRNIGP